MPFIWIVLLLVVVCVAIWFFGRKKKREPRLVKHVSFSLKKHLVTRTNDPSEYLYKTWPVFTASPEYIHNLDALVGQLQNPSEYTKLLLDPNFDGSSWVENPEITGEIIDPVLWELDFDRVPEPTKNLFLKAVGENGHYFSKDVETFIAKGDEE